MNTFRKEINKTRRYLEQLRQQAINRGMPPDSDFTDDQLTDLAAECLPDMAVQVQDAT